MHEQKSNLMIPASIILAGFLVATGIYFSNKGNTPAVKNNPANETATNINIKPVSSTDHILGDPNAPIVLVEFSDTECPYCKVFQTTMQTVMSTYGKAGQIAWVYRHFPLSKPDAQGNVLHRKSPKEAEATECVNELDGNTAFWKMLDTIYANTPGNDGLDLAKLPEYAKSAGVDVTKFNTCLASGKYADAVEADFQDGVNAGAQGTPYNVLILKSALSSSAESTINDFVLKNGLARNVIISSNKKEVVLNGALPIAMMKIVLDAILK